MYSRTSRFHLSNLTALLRLEIGVLAGAFGRFLTGGDGQLAQNHRHVMVNWRTPYWKTTSDQDMIGSRDEWLKPINILLPPVG